MDSAMNGATRQSQRIRASGFRVCHYFLEEDGIDTEASFRQKIEGCFSPSTDIGAVERNTLDANLSEVILNGRPTKLLRSSEVVHSWGIRRRRKRRPPKLPKAYQNLAAEEQRCDVSCFVSGGPNGMEGCREHVKDDMGLKLAQYTAEPLLQYTAYNVQTRCREYENAVNGFFSQQNQELRGYVTDPELTTKTTCVSVDHAGENARNNIENHSQNMISVCHEGNRFSIATSNQALVGQLNHASSQVIGKFESERRPSNCRKVMGMPDQLNRCVRESLNHITTVQQIQGFGNELHVTGVNQYNTHGFGSFHEMMSICEQRSHYSSADQNVDQNRRLPQDVSFQQEENAQACYNGVVLNMPKRSIHDTNWFPFSNCKQTESSPSCNASSTDYLTFTPEWTPVQISDSLDSGQSMTMNSNANLSHLAFGHSEYPASQLSIWGNNAVPIQHSSKLSVFHEASNSSGTCPSSKSSPEYAQTQASTNQLNTVDPNFNNRDLSYVSSNTDLFQQDETSSLKGVSCSGTILPSSSPMDLECLDANSAGDVHHRDSSISCFNKDSKKERLSDLRVKMRNTHLVGNNTSTTQRSEGQAGRTNSGIGRSLRKLLSGIRNGNNCIGTNSGAPHNDDPPKKLRRKKVRCKVQKDETKRKGRGGRRKNPLHANLQREGFSFQGHKLYSVISSIIEAKNLSGMSPLEGRKAKRPNNRPVILMRSCSQDNPPFNEDCNIPSEISNIGEKMNFYDLNTSMDENYEAGFKTNYIDFLAKSDQRNLSQTKDTVSTFECPQAGMFSILPCQELALYGNPMHQNRHGKELLLSHFTADGFETLSLSAGGSLETSNIVPYKRSMDRLLHKMPVQGSSGNLQLAKLNRKDELQMVLYNQKRDIVASKIRAYKKIRAKVLLDSESQRVWLQLENGAEPRDEDDPDKARHWEKQREDMRQIVDSFIKKMHDVQGNRKFSPWKGSIVDSVVGAFLTQNVSDHLSSSAFMSVASRFPPASKKDSPASCSVLRERFCSQRHFEIGSIPLEKVALSSAIEPAFYEEHDGNSGFTDEIKDVKYDFMEPAVQSSDNKIQASSVGDNIEDTAQYHGDNCISTPVSHTAHYYGDSCVSTPVSHTLVRKQDIVARDDENASMLDAIKDISGTFRQHSEVHSLTARRRLNFGADTKEQTQSFVNPEPDKKVCLAASQEQECASDNISDLHSESESAAGSFGSVHSVQDSNFQTSIIPQDTLELEVGASTVQTSIMMQDPSAVAQVESKVNKKRPMALSSISGIERAQLEVNQKGRKRNHHTDWESVRRQALGLPCGTVKGTDGPDPRSYLHEDSVDWEAVRFAELGVFADTIKERGMHHVLSGRIKAFLNSVHEDHGSIDLEWLRILSPEKAREYLTSIHGLGVKSVECIRLLTLHHHAFPVDTNVGRICVRLGWVPIEPLPEEVQLHLVELYPIQETIQKYLWPRLCTLDQRTLYELHYQLITFGKVFCTKSKPNCNACPMRTECKHFASAYASAKPLLTGSNSDQSNWLYANGASNELPTLGLDVAYLEYSQVKPADLWHSQEAPIVSELDNNAEFLCNDLGYSNDLFFVEEPTSSDEADVEDTGYIYDGHNVSSEELFHDNYSMGFGSTPKESSSFTESQRSINLNAVCTSNPQLSSDIHEDLSCICAQSTHIAETPSRMPCCSTQSIMSFDSSTNKGAYPTDLVVEVSQTAIVPIPEAAQIPAPKLKSIGRLRTIHYVYELPDDHELLKMLQADARQKDDPCCYLLAIWSPGETPESQQEIDELCRDDFSAFTVGRADENVSGTLLIPCRTAMRGSFPLNGTYFQVNEVFADHSSSLCPVQVPRSLIWSLRRRFVYFGTSIPNIFKGLSREEIKDCFWRGHVCVRGFDRKTRAPKPLVCRLHFPISKQLQGTRKAQGRKKEEAAGLSLESSRKQCSTKQVDFLEFERANTTL